MHPTFKNSTLAALTILCAAAAPRAQADLIGLEAVDGILTRNGQVFHVMDIYLKFSAADDRLIKLTSTSIQLTGAAGAKFYNASGAGCAAIPSIDMADSPLADVDTYVGMGGEQWANQSLTLTPNCPADLLVNQSSVSTPGGWFADPEPYPGDDLRIRVARLTIRHVDWTPGATVHVGWVVKWTGAGYCSTVNESVVLNHVYPPTALPFMPADVLPDGAYPNIYAPPPAPVGSIEGSHVAWLSPNGYITGWSFVGFSFGHSACLEQQVPATRKLIGHGDVNGDGEDDLFFYDTAEASVHVWTLQGGYLAQDVLIGAAPGPASAGWHVIGVGDVNGDGQADLLWRNSAGGLGQVRAWLVQNATVIADKTLGISVGFKFLALADFNNDGKSDILWQLPGGTLLAWKLNGTAAPVPKMIANSSYVPITWQFVTACDLNGDGTSDLVWRNLENGKVSAWKVKNFARTSGAQIGSGMGSNWEFCGTCDLENDGNADLLWRKNSNGVMNAWQMHGVQKVNDGTIAPLGTGAWIPW